MAFEGNGCVTAVRVATVDRGFHQVGEPFSLRADLVAVAAGQNRLEELLASIPGGIEHTRGRVDVDADTGRTSNPKYWAGGDLANGGAEVVNAKAADAWFTVDLRSTDQKSIDDFERRIEAIIQEEATRFGVTVKTEDVEEKVPAAQIPGNRESFTVRMELAWVYE